jgi:ADP-heptose:LPS heptosyltransferase
MGYGDELIATGQARRLQQLDKRKVLIRDRNGRIRWSEMWANNPRIFSPADRCTAQEITNGPGVRPYIAAKTDRQWFWRDWECPRGEIYFSEDEIGFAAALPAPVVVIEPNNKPKASPNKDWGRERWTRLALLLRDEGLPATQLGPPGTQVIDRAKIIHTPSFRHACAVLARARVAVLPEGGLHHAAAAIGVPAVVLFGGFISPKQTGYQGQVSLFTGGTPCGMRIDCKHCKDAMAAITPEAVVEEVKRLVAAA